MRNNRGILALPTEHSPCPSGLEDSSKLDNLATIVDHKKSSSISSKTWVLRKGAGRDVCHTKRCLWYTESAVSLIHDHAYEYAATSRRVSEQTVAHGDDAFCARGHGGRNRAALVSTSLNKSPRAPFLGFSYTRSSVVCIYSAVSYARISMRHSLNNRA